MSSTKVSIVDPTIRIRPADSLRTFIAQLGADIANGMTTDNMRGIYQLYTGIKCPNVNAETRSTSEEPPPLVKPTLSSADVQFLRDLNTAANANIDGVPQPIQLADVLTTTETESEGGYGTDGDADGTEDDDEQPVDKVDKPSKTRTKRLKDQRKERARAQARLQLTDLIWLNSVLQKRRADAADSGEEVVYLHQLLSGSQLRLPRNEIRERDAALEARCVRLRLEQDARVYNAMTKNVDSSRRQLPDETISYQMKAINRQMIAVAQFLFSVAAGFAFGFIGVELLIGNLDFGFRLLLGIICALVIALAEIYFLAKQLNEEYDVSVAEKDVVLKPDSSAKVTETKSSAAVSNVKSGGKSIKSHAD